MSARIILNPVQNKLSRTQKRMILARKCWKLQVLIFYVRWVTAVHLWVAASTSSKVPGFLCNQSFIYLFFHLSAMQENRNGWLEDLMMVWMGQWVDSSFLVEVASGLYCCTTKPHICNLGLKSQFQNCTGNLKLRAVLTFSSEPCPHTDGRGWLSHSAFNIKELFSTKKH